MIDYTRKSVAKPLSSSVSLPNKMLKILKDTRDYYSKDPANRRSMSEDGDCMYTWGDNHCAVGRYLDSEYQRENWDYNYKSVDEIKANCSIDWALRDDVQGLCSEFWQDLQSFHDDNAHWITWSVYGLTEKGKVKYQQIKDNILLGDFYELNLGDK